MLGSSTRVRFVERLCDRDSSEPGIVPFVLGVMVTAEIRLAAREVRLGRSVADSEPAASGEEADSRTS